jgi:hypothetical protein
LLLLLEPRCCAQRLMRGVAAGTSAERSGAATGGGGPAALPDPDLGGMRSLAIGSVNDVPVVRDMCWERGLARTRLPKRLWRTDEASAEKATSAKTDVGATSQHVAKWCRHGKELEVEPRSGTRRDGLDRSVNAHCFPKVDLNHHGWTRPQNSFGASSV